MSKELGFRARFIFFLIPAGIVVSLAEPSAFLNDCTDRVILRMMLPRSRDSVCKVVLPLQSSEGEIAEKIVELKSNGVRGILVLIPPKNVAPESALHDALKMEGVIWLSQVARQLVDSPQGFALGKTHLIIDRDTKYVDDFRHTLESAGVKIVLCPAHAPDPGQDSAWMGGGNLTRLVREWEIVPRNA